MTKLNYSVSRNAPHAEEIMTLKIAAIPENTLASQNSLLESALRKETISSDLSKQIKRNSSTELKIQNLAVTLLANVYKNSKMATMTNAKHEHLPSITNLARITTSHSALSINVLTLNTKSNSHSRTWILSTTLISLRILKRNEITTAFQLALTMNGLIK